MGKVAVGHFDDSLLVSSFRIVLCLIRTPNEFFQSMVFIAGTSHMSQICIMPSWRLLKSGSSRPDEGRYGAGAEADSGAGSGGSGRIPSFLFLFGLVWVGLSFSLFICQRG